MKYIACTSLTLWVAWAQCTQGDLAHLHQLGKYPPRVGSFLAPGLVAKDYEGALFQRAQVPVPIGQAQTTPAVASYFRDFESLWCEPFGITSFLYEGKIIFRLNGQFIPYLVLHMIPLVFGLNQAIVHRKEQTQPRGKIQNHRD